MYIQLFQEISILCIISIKFNKPLDIYSCIVMLNLFRAYGRELPPLLIQLTWSLTKSLPKSRSPAILPTVESPKLHNTHKYAEQMMHLIFTSANVSHFSQFTAKRWFIQYNFGGTHNTNRLLQTRWTWKRWTWNWTGNCSVVFWVPWKFETIFVPSSLGDLVLQHYMVYTRICK